MVVCTSSTFAVPCLVTSLLAPSSRHGSGLGLRRLTKLGALFAVGAVSSALGCALGATGEDKRASGQSGLMSQTAAGQDTCDPKTHKRPFIIEWDATDMSSFEQHAANDVVFVRYEGCELQVLDECGAPVALTADQIRASPSDLNEVGGMSSGDPRTVDKLLDPRNVTTDSWHMWNTRPPQHDSHQTPHHSRDIPFKTTLHNTHV